MDEPKIEQAIPIDPKGKYVVILQGTTMDEHQYARARRAIDDWWESNNPFLIVGNVKLVRVGEQE